MNRLETPIKGSRILHDAAPPAAQVEATMTGAPLVGAAGDYVLEALVTCESRQVALDSWGMSFAVGIYLLLCVFMGVWSLVRLGFFPYFFVLLMTLFGFGGILLAIHKPWLDRRPRQRECQELLQQLEVCDSLEGPNRKLALDTLNMLALPTSGESRETRKLARRLYQRHKSANNSNLPIAAETLAQDCNRLPVPAAEVSTER